jgi:hypothetical protein
MEQVMGATEKIDNERQREIASALGAAADQIELALRDSQPAVEALGHSLARLAELLGDINGAEDDAQLQTLRREMALAVTGLQFYDRMTQHLSHVRDYLSGSSKHVDPASGTAKEDLDELGRRLADRLLSDTHRMYLGRSFQADLLSGRGALSRAERGAASPGDVDLF